MLLFILGCLLSAFWVAFVTTWLMRGLAPRWELIDKPAARKVHRVPTPLGGGIGIWAGVIVPLAVVQILLLQSPEFLSRFVPAELLPHLSGALGASDSGGHSSEAPFSFDGCVGSDLVGPAWRLLASTSKSLA